MQNKASIKLYFFKQCVFLVIVIDRYSWNRADHCVIGRKLEFLYVLFNGEVALWTNFLSTQNNPEIPTKNLPKVVKFQNLVAKFCKYEKNSLAKVANFLYFCITCGNCFWAEGLIYSVFKTFFNQILEFYYFQKVLSGFSWH